MPKPETANHGCKPISGLSTFFFIFWTKADLTTISVAGEGEGGGGRVSVTDGGILVAVVVGQTNIRYILYCV